MVRHMARDPADEWTLQAIISVGTFVQ